MSTGEGGCDGGRGAGAAVELLLAWIEWLEVEAQGVDHFEEKLRRLRGAGMVAALTKEVTALC